MMGAALSMAVADERALRRGRSAPLMPEATASGMSEAVYPTACFASTAPPSNTQHPSILTPAPPKGPIHERRRPSR